ncbi:MAG: bifunctional hexulose-6-phosphate synthase/ribonuclease regulator [Candidatus Lokiarchaeota archaeon]|nr:bifunctional hexulose-6-phosphate synthase/ribonuclease regulator [Candidatus Lokiarchaeota archaeon]MBD3341113.1 bifunctional hexulose-6-phosphate synthase/ribonuclease regulator [Candidatus Lokiarchaeota archaeon]
MLRKREEPYLQIALDLINLSRAEQIAREAIKGGVDWIEAGTPLIKSEGMNAVRTLHRSFPNHIIVADMKTADGGSIEIEIAAKSGANVVLMLGGSDNASVTEAIEAAEKYGVMLGVDTIDVPEDRLIERALELERLGVDMVCSHVGVDQQVIYGGEKTLEIAGKLKKKLRSTTWLAIAGGINSETAARAKEIGVDVIIVGGALYKSESPEKSASNIKNAINSAKPVDSSLFKKYDEAHIRDALMLVSSSNISDAMHRSGEMKGLKAVWNGDEENPLKFVGPAVTVRAYNGDWSKPVEAIEIAQKGDVIVIDACEGMDAVWGELASWSCKVKGISGVVIDGAVRDLDDIRRIKFPIYARHFTPTAGEPRGLGEINVSIVCAGQKVDPGDWIVGDQSGVVVIKKNKAQEMANRAIDVLEKENRFREEIKRGSTLSEVLYLKKWEKQK